MYCLRRIPFGGHDRTVVLQAQAGPCPILAITNVLSLRGLLHFHPSAQRVAFAEIVQLLREYLSKRLETMSVAPNVSEETLASLFSSFDEVNASLPKFEHGLDVNVIFKDVARFEFTPEIAVFDSFSVSLFHVWAIDPEDIETARVLSEQSYNQITQFITSEDLDIPNFEAAASPVAASAALPVAATESRVAATAEAAALSASDAGGMAGVAADAGTHTASISHTDVAGPPAGRAAAGIDGGSAEAKYDDYPDGDAPNDTPIAPAPTRFVFVPSPAPESVEPLAQSEVASAAVETSSAAPISSTAPSSAANKSQERDRLLALRENDRTIARRFLIDTSSQITVFGLISLQTRLQENELVALFHNNHFSVLWKYRGEMYELITDVRIVDEQPLLVWTKLAQTDNDSLFLDAFLRIPRQHATEAAQQYNAQRRSAHSNALQRHFDTHGSLPTGSSGPDNYYWAHHYHPAYAQAERDRIAHQQQQPPPPPPPQSQPRSAVSAAGKVPLGQNAQPPLAAARSSAGPAVALGRAMSPEEQAAHTRRMYDQQEAVLRQEKEEYHRQAAARRKAEAAKDDDSCVVM